MTLARHGTVRLHAESWDRAKLLARDVGARSVRELVEVALDVLAQPAAHAMRDATRRALRGEAEFKDEPGE